MIIIKTALTIAGSDSSGGAGITADIKTFAAYGIYGMNVITAITAQNTLGVTDVIQLQPHMVAAQLDAVFSDIFPSAVKIGMVSSEPLIDIIAKKLKKYQANNVVLDTVMYSKGGYSLLEPRAVACLKNLLLPVACVITPNIPEAQMLCAMEIKTKEDMVAACHKISGFYKGHILLKGGHLTQSADDLLFYKSSSGWDMHWFNAERIDTQHTHGTGCTLSSAICANLALGAPIIDAIAEAKEYVRKAMSTGIRLGSGIGPLIHNFPGGRML